MTDNKHPITPPPELVQQWCKQRACINEPGPIHLWLATEAARWGADQELEACCTHMNDWGNIHHSCGLDLSNFLRTARRPEPLSLKEQALAALARLKSGALCADRVTDESIIRRAIESLPD